MAPFPDIFTEMAALLMIAAVVGALGVSLRQPLIVAFIVVVRVRLRARFVDANWNDEEGFKFSDYWCRWLVNAAAALSVLASLRLLEAFSIVSEAGGETIRRKLDGPSDRRALRWPLSSPTATDGPSLCGHIRTPRAPESAVASRHSAQVYVLCSTTPRPMTSSSIYRSHENIEIARHLLRNGNSFSNSVARAMAATG